MSFDSETESIVWPTLYHSAALRRSSFSASFDGAMMPLPAFALVSPNMCGSVCGVARRVQCRQTRGDSRDLKTLSPLSPSHFTSSPTHTHQSRNRSQLGRHHTRVDSKSCRDLESPVAVTSDLQTSLAHFDLSKSFTFKVALIAVKIWLSLHIYIHQVFVLDATEPSSEACRLWNVVFHASSRGSTRGMLATS